MINIVFYLKKEHDPIVLIEKLLRLELIASASVDVDNCTYTTEDGKLTKIIHSVITAQTKSLLFAEISKIVEEDYGVDIPINSVPIVVCNKVFDSTIRLKTRAV